MWRYTRISSPEKAATTHVKNTIIFHVCWILLISCWRVTSFSRHSVMLMNSKTFTNLNPRFSSDDGCQNTENFISLTDSDVQKFFRREENQNTKRKTESCVFCGVGHGITRCWERKLTVGRLVTGRFRPCYLKTTFPYAIYHQYHSSSHQNKRIGNVLPKLRLRSQYFTVFVSSRYSCSSLNICTGE